MKSFKLFDDVETSHASPSLETQATTDTLHTRATQDTIDINKWEEYIDNQEASQKANQLMANIKKGILAGSNTNTLLLQALECIRLMSGDKTFYRQSVEQIKLIYGDDEALPPEFELHEVKERLQALQQYDLKSVPADKAKWIIQAMHLHRERETYLLKQIKSGD